MKINNYQWKIESNRFIKIPEVFCFFHFKFPDPRKNLDVCKIGNWNVQFILVVSGHAYFPLSSWFYSLRFDILISQEKTMTIRGEAHPYETIESKSELQSRWIMTEQVNSCLILFLHRNTLGHCFGWMIVCMMSFKNLLNQNEQQIWWPRHWRLKSMYFILYVLSFHLSFLIHMLSYISHFNSSLVFLNFLLKSIEDLHLVERHIRLCILKCD